MAWSNSKIFETFVVAALDRTTNFDIDTDTPKVALYADPPMTPSNTVSLANSAYGVDQWISSATGTNEVFEAGQWAQTGVALSGHDVTTSSGVIKYDATDTASGSAFTTSHAVYGCLVYDDTVVGDYGICYNYFGGGNTVTNGTFTVVWNASGIFSISVA